MRVVPIIVSVSFTLEPCATFLLSWLPQFLFGRVLKSSKFSLGKVEKEKIILRVHVILFIYMLWGRKVYSKDSLHVVLFIVIIYHEIYESILKILIFYSPIKKKKLKEKLSILVFKKRVTILIWKTTSIIILRFIIFSLPLSYNVTRKKKLWY